MLNPWKILVVHRKTSEGDVREAYYDLARKYHPDMKNGDADKFQVISKAYHLIKDKATIKEFLALLAPKPDDCQKCKGQGVLSKSKGLTAKTYTACNGCGGAGVILGEEEDVAIELRGTSGISSKGRHKKR